jgi:Bacterial TSP3 repeat
MLQYGASGYTTDMKTSLLLLVATLFLATPACAASRDRDRDLLPDRWEQKHGYSPKKKSDARVDRDYDGLNTLREYRLKTNPSKADSDRDGMLDGWEVRYKLNPRTNDATRDADNDGFSNINEYRAGTNPRRKNPEETTTKTPSTTPSYNDNQLAVPIPKEEPTSYVHAPDVRVQARQRQSTSSYKFYPTYTVDVDINIYNNDSQPARVFLDLDGDNRYEIDNGSSTVYQFIPSQTGDFTIGVLATNTVGFGKSSYRYQVIPRLLNTKQWNPTTQGCFEVLLCSDLLLNHECPTEGDCDTVRCKAATDNYTLGLKLFNNWFYSDTVIDIGTTLKPTFDYYGEALRYNTAALGNRLMHWELIDAYCGRVNQKAARTQVKQLVDGRGGISVTAHVPFPAIPENKQRVLDLLFTALEISGTQLKSSHCNTDQGNSSSMELTPSKLIFEYTVGRSC